MNRESNEMSEQKAPEKKQIIELSAKDLGEVQGGYLTGLSIYGKKASYSYVGKKASRSLYGIKF